MRPLLTPFVLSAGIAFACGGSGAVAPKSAATIQTNAGMTATACPTDAASTDPSVPGIPRPLVCGRAPGKFDVQHTASGAFFVDERRGTGTEAQAGALVSIKFTGYLIDGTVFDSSENPMEPTSFTLGAGSVIKAWDEGIAGMKVGGIRRIGVPPEAAFATSGGLGGKVPPNASLAYDIELLSVQ